MKLDLASVCLALCLGFIFVVLFETFRINSYRGQTPPGPRPLPFVGTIPYFLNNPMEFIRSVSVCFEYRGFACDERCLMFTLLCKMCVLT